MRARKFWAFAVLVMACGGDSGEKGAGAAAVDERWSCTESSSGCLCEHAKPGWEIQLGGRDVDACFDWHCCLRSESNTESTDGRCECFSEGTDCAALAASRRNTEVVDTCPPGAKPQQLACANVNENCDTDYLANSGLEGCCPGSICDRGDQGIRVCRTATPEEETRSRECSRAAYSRETELQVVAGTLQTNVGTFTLDTVDQYAQPHVGAGGCPSGIDFTLHDASGACSFEIHAELASGTIRVVRVMVDFERCQGYTGERFHGLQLASLPGDPIDFEIDLDMLSCDSTGFDVAYCLAGRVDLLVQGEIGEVEFSPSHIVIAGVVCSDDPEGECPVM